MAAVLPTAGGAEVHLAPAERDLLVRLCEGLAGRLRAGGDDAVIARLAPAASRADAEADHELRRMLRTDLLDGRAERLTRLAVALAGWGATGPDATGSVGAELAPDAALDLLRGLNDLRLALGATVDVERLDRTVLSEDDPRTATLDLMDRLAGLQQGLVEVLDA